MGGCNHPSAWNVIAVLINFVTVGVHPHFLRDWPAGGSQGAVTSAQKSGRRNQAGESCLPIYSLS
jgi:hypothetical protein